MSKKKMIATIKLINTPNTWHSYLFEVFLFTCFLCFFFFWCGNNTRFTVNKFQTYNTVFYLQLSQKKKNKYHF